MLARWRWALEAVQCTNRQSHSLNRMTSVEQTETVIANGQQGLMTHLSASAKNPVIDEGQCLSLTRLFAASMHAAPVQPFACFRSKRLFAFVTRDSVPR